MSSLLAVIGEMLFLPDLCVPTYLSAMVLSSVLYVSSNPFFTRIRKLLFKLVRFGCFPFDKQKHAAHFFQRSYGLSVLNAICTKYISWLCDFIHFTGFLNSLSSNKLLKSERVVFGSMYSPWSRAANIFFYRILSGWNEILPCLYVWDASGV